MRDPERGTKLEAEAAALCTEALKGAPAERLVAAIIVEGPDFGLYSLINRGGDRRDLVRALKKVVALIEGN